MSKLLTLLALTCTFGVGCSDPDYDEISERQQDKMNRMWEEQNKPKNNPQNLNTNGTYSSYSYRCQVTLLNGAAQVGPGGSYDNRYEVKSLSYCIGRSATGYMRGDLSQQVHLTGEEVFAQVDMKYVDTAAVAPNNYSSCRVQIQKKTEAGLENYADEFYYRPSAPYTRVGYTYDNKYQYVIRCEPTSVCE